MHLKTMVALALLIGLAVLLAGCPGKRGRRMYGGLNGNPVGGVQIAQSAVRNQPERVGGEIVPRVGGVRAA
jgi:hypothetical protein